MSDPSFRNRQRLLRGRSGWRPGPLAQSPRSRRVARGPRAGRQPHLLGASFSNHTGITDKKPTIQVDFDPMALGKFHAVDVPVWGEIGITRMARRRRRLTRAVDDDAILTVDVGNNAYSFGRYFECRRQAVLMSGYLGSIGFAYPAALGAWAATLEEGTPFTGRQVVAVSGDGGYGQYLAEITTAVKYGMNITHLVLNNDELGKISKEQRAGSLDVWQTSLHNPDFSEYAKLCGAFGIRVRDASELDDALARALAYDGPATVEVVADGMLA